MAMQTELEWCDANMTTDYPLVVVNPSAIVGRSTSGVYLPQSFLVDAQLIFPSSAAVRYRSSLYISKISCVDSGFTVQVSCYISNDLSIPCGITGVIPDSVRNTDDIAARTFSINSLDVPDDYRELGGMSGYFIIGSCVDMQNVGVMEFSYGSAALIGIRMFCYDTGLDSVTFIDADNNSTTLYKDFTIKAGDGIDFEISTTPGGEPVVRIVRVPTAKESANSYTDIDSVISAVLANLGQPILRVNGIAPSATGNITIEGGDCVSVRTQGNSITISNPCSKPCCQDTTTTDDISSSLELLESAQQRLQGYYETINNNINMIQARLASLISSRS